MVPAILLLGLVMVAHSAAPPRAVDAPSVQAPVQPPPGPGPGQVEQPPAPAVPEDARRDAARQGVLELEAWRTANPAADPAELHRRAVGALSTAQAYPELRARADAVRRTALEALEQELRATLRTGEALEAAGLWWQAQQVYRGWLRKTGEGAPTATSPAFAALKRCGQVQSKVTKDRDAIEACLRAGNGAGAEALATWIGVYAGPEAERQVRDTYPALRR